MPPVLDLAARENGLRVSLSRLRYRFSQRRLALFQTVTVSVSKAMRERLIKDCGFPERTTLTVANGVAVSRFTPAPDSLRRVGWQSDELRLVCVARLGPEKRIDLLLASLELALRKGVRCRCVVVGDGPLKSEVLQQAISLGIADHVVFEGFQADVRPFLQTADAFILTSEREGMPLSILEAMACGLPCIVTDVGGNSEVVVDGSSGLVVPSESPEKAADAIVFLAKHPEERLRMGKNARTRVCEEFDLDKSMARIERIILN